MNYVLADGKKCQLLSFQPRIYVLSDMSGAQTANLQIPHGRRGVGAQNILRPEGLSDTILSLSMLLSVEM